MACGSRSAQAQDVPVLVEHVNQHQSPVMLQGKVARMPDADQFYLGKKKYPLFDLTTSVWPFFVLWNGTSGMNYCPSDCVVI